MRKKRKNNLIIILAIIVIILGVIVLIYNLNNKGILLSPFCVDTDSNATYPDGKNIYKLGNIYNGTSWGTDSCTNVYRVSDAVKEYYCRSDGAVTNSVLICPSNKCVDGACVQQKPQCSDGIDNDNDGVIDYSDDTGCVSANDISEFKDSDAILALNSNIVLLDPGIFVPGMGINPHVKGTIKVVNVDSYPFSSEPYNVTFSDYCHSSKILVEFYEGMPSEMIHKTCFECSGGCVYDVGIGKCQEVICSTKGVN